MIVVLPNRFEGGTLVVRHGAATQTLTFDEAAGGKAPCYAAFYADCEHEVQRVTSGVRLCLAYNLVLKPKRVKASAAAKAAAPADVLAESIGSWVAKQPAKPLVFTLEHHYTQRGLSLDLPPSNRTTRCFRSHRNSRQHRSDDRDARRRSPTGDTSGQVCCLHCPYSPRIPRKSASSRRSASTIRWTTDRTRYLPKAASRRGHLSLSSDQIILVSLADLESTPWRAVTIKITSTETAIVRELQQMA